MIPEAMFPIRAMRTSVLSRTWLRVAVAAALAACHRPVSTPRERVLAGLPGDAVAVAVADGRALSHPRIRGVLDVAAARWPASLGCVIDAAVASDAIGLAVDRASNVTVLAALPRSPRCPALSQRAPGLWIATLGAGPSTGAPAVLDDPRFARARPYLETSPIAAVVLGDVHLLAAAQPDPLDAWVAIDVAPDVPGGADTLAQAVAEQVARLARDPSTAPVAGALRTSRSGPTQLVVRLTGPVDADLTAAVRTVLGWVDASGDPASPAGPAFTCPAPSPGVTCTGGTSYRLASLAGDLSSIATTGHPTPIVSNGSVTGLRLDAPVRELGLEAGDVVIAMAGRLVTSRTMLTDRIAHARVETTITIRRGATEAMLRFAEH